ncbi:prenyltransferase [Candidatus Parvarchaeota archaeon]|nr:prenyltransferase [Candidatus Parvarchaeota archaeon]
MEFIKKFAMASRAPFLAASILPALVGGAIALGDGKFSLVPFLAAMAAAIFAHLGTNLSNDYFDYKNGNYPAKKTGPTGGSFAIQSRMFSESEIIRMAYACFGISAALFIYLGLSISPVVLALGLLGIAIGYFYTAPPFALGYRGLGEIATFVGMGPLLLQTVYFAQAGSFSEIGWYVSAFIGVLVSNILLVAQIPDIAIDKKSRKKTLAASWGAGAAISAFTLFTLVGGAVLAAGILLGKAPMFLAVGLLGILGTAHIRRHFESKDYGLGVKEAVDMLVVCSLFTIAGLLVGRI